MNLSGNLVKIKRNTCKKVLTKNLTIFTDLRNNFDETIRQSSDSSAAVCAIKCLLEYIKQEPFGTVTELREKVIQAIDTLTTTDSSAISIKSGCELLLRFITLTALDAGVS